MLFIRNRQDENQPLCAFGISLAQRITDLGNDGDEVSLLLGNIQVLEAKMAFKEENEESQIQLAAFPYSDIQDDKVKISESDLKAKYDEIKARFKQPVESRDIKFVDIEVQASNADRAALNKEFAGYHSQLDTYFDLRIASLEIMEIL